MDPVTAVVVSAIAAGALAGVGDTAAQAVKDAYTRLKNLLSRKYSDVDVTALERKPESKSKKDSLAEDLADAGAAGDPELGTAAAAVLESVQQHAPQAVVGVNVTGLVSAALTITAVASTGDGVRVTDSTIEGATEIRDVEAGFTASRGPSTARD
ncbi:hypothetical protein [Nocardia sp. NPDC057272]|uniref:hypothetical protein n=1 Tax=Nocardia sp. NPDC057272 TaxID=3346079 RepID=UPI003641C470